jgi:SAM-dependent methyltransferase
MALWSCTGCGFVSGEPKRPQQLEEHYAYTYDAAQPPQPVARYHQWLDRAEAVIGRGRLLEVGAGAGGFVTTALARGWGVDATEISRSGVERLSRTAARVHHGPLEAAGYPDGHFDLCVSLEVLEHVPAPVAHLRELARVTRAGGLLLLTTPNFAGLSRRRFGLGWRVIDPEHLGYFTRSTLGRALRDAGFSQASIRSRSLDVLSWRRRGPGAATPAFDPQASAELRDTVAARPALRLARDATQGVLWLTGLGDSLLAWARR